MERTKPSDGPVIPKGMITSVLPTHRSYLLASESISNGNAKVLFILLGDLFEPGKEHVYPGMKLMARMLGITFEALRSAESALRQAGLITFSKTAKSTDRTFVMNTLASAVKESQVLAYQEVMCVIGRPLVPQVHIKRRDPNDPIQAPTEIQIDEIKVEEPKEESPMQEQSTPSGNSDAPLITIPRGRKRKTKPKDSEEERAKKLAEQAQKHRMYELACKSFNHMEAYLLHGAEGLLLHDDGKPWDEIAKAPAAPMNWRRFFELGPDGKVIMEEGRPKNIINVSKPAFAGYYWYTVSLYLARRNIPLFTPDWPKLIGIVSRTVDAYGPKLMFDRIVAYGQHFDTIMSLVNKQGTLPGVDSLSNSLVEQAYRQWCSLSDEQKYEATQRVQNT